MKAFVLKTALFLLIPFLVLGTAELLLPVNVFTHRVWESISFQTTILRSACFYPNQQVEMISEGDLCYHTPNAILKQENWITDKLGFRNEAFMEESDVLFIGDSFIAGSALSTKDLVSEQLEKASGNRIRAYNMATTNLSKFDYLLKRNVLKKPRVLIVAYVERIVPPLLNPYYPERASRLKQMAIDVCEYNRFNMWYDRMFRFNSLNWLRSTVVQAKGPGVTSPEAKGMYFLNGKNQKTSMDAARFTVQVAQTYQKYCQDLGIRFYLMPLPDKESVYFNRVPLPTQPRYLLAMDSLMKSQNLPIISLIHPFTQYAQTHSELLYHLDDSHWNANGTALAAQVILKRLNEDGLFLPQ